MTKLRFSDMDTSVEYYIAERDVLSIEAELLERLKNEDPSSDELEIIAAQKAALREIDHLKDSGIYEIEQARLKDLIIPTFNIKLPKIDPGFAARLRNLTAGPQSPDSEQRARFRKFSDAFGLGRKAPKDIGDYLWALEPVVGSKRRRGRPRISTPWANSIRALDEMRELMVSGVEFADASRQVAQKKGKSGLEERAKNIRKLYKQRQNLRE